MSLYSYVNAYEQISSFYPRWYLDVYEMREIIRIEALVAENMQKAIDLILDNHFLDTINEEKASELEAYLHISDISDRTIEERRAIIKSYFLGRGKLSLSQIIAIVKALSGGNCTGSFLPGDSYCNNYIRLKITDCDIKLMLVDIISTLQERIPAHLWIELEYIPKGVETTLFTSVVSRSTITSCIKISANIVYGGNFKSNYSDEINGGPLTQTDYEQTIDGRY